IVYGTSSIPFGFESSTMNIGEEPDVPMPAPRAFILCLSGLPIPIKPIGFCVSLPAKRPSSPNSAVVVGLASLDTETTRPGFLFSGRCIPALGVFPVTAAARELIALSLFVIAPSTEFAQMDAELSAHAIWLPLLGLLSYSYGTHVSVAETPIFTYESIIFFCLSTHCEGGLSDEGLSSSIPHGFSVVFTLTFASSLNFSTNLSPSAPMLA